MRTFNLEKEIHTVAETAQTYEQVLDCYIDLGQRMIELEMQKQALAEAVAEVVSEEQAVDISTKVSQKIDEHMWRNTTQAAREMLYEYGYKKPVVLCTYDEAIDLVDRKEPVFMLNGNNTEKLATSREEVDVHMSIGGLCGTTQFVIDQDIEYVLHGGDIEEDYE